MRSHEQKKKANEEPLVSRHLELFHYTSLHALSGILETNTLGATHAEYLNDSSEMKLLWPKLESQFIAYLKAAFEVVHRCDPEIREAVERVGRVHKVAEREGITIMGIIRSLLFGDESRHGIGIPFVASFTTHKEGDHCRNGMLSQWRGYGGAQGVAIIFDKARLDDLLHTEESGFVYLSCFIKPAVYYDKGELKLEVHFPKLSDAMVNYSKDVVNGLNDGKKERRNREALAKNLLPTIGTLKHPAFREESECRVVVGVCHESYGYQLSQLGGQQRRTKTIHHRLGSCGSIPYVRLLRILAKNFQFREY